jgi:uncharacterized membrane protein
MDARKEPGPAPIADDEPRKARFAVVDENLTAAARENIEILTEYSEREEAEVSRMQSAIEKISRLVGSPAYFVGALCFIVAWICLNGWGAHAGWRVVDKPPFYWLQGLVSSNALLLTVAVLIRQTRMEKLAARRAHLDLHVNLLTERKVAKVLEIVDALHRDLSSTKRLVDPETEELAEPADPEAILRAIKDADPHESS